MSLAKKLGTNHKAEYKIGDLVFVFGSWKGTVIGIQKGRMGITKQGNIRVKTNTFFYKIRYTHEWMGKIKEVVGLKESFCLRRRK
jgi:hypothetical protein